MDRDAITEIGIDDKDRLYLAPSAKAFPNIYREAMEVHWDDQGRHLHAPLPARAQLAQLIWWFERILAAAREQNCELYIDQQTKWHNVPAQLKSEILAVTGVPPMPNTTVDLAPFGRWTLRDKAAQRRSPTR